MSSQNGTASELTSNVGRYTTRQICLLLLFSAIFPVASFPVEANIPKTSQYVCGHSPSRAISLLKAVNNHNHGNDPNDDQTPSIPAGEEALLSARMAQSIRHFRTSRGLVSSETETDSNSNVISEEEATKIMERRSKLLRVQSHSMKITKTKTKRTKTQGWTAERQQSIERNLAHTKTRTIIRDDIVVPHTKSSKPTSLKISPDTRVRRTNGVDLPYFSAIRALQVFYDENGHLVLPRRFVVPDDSNYPREWWGVDLARAVYDMKWWQQNVKEKPDRVAELNKMGFLWERLQPEWNLVLESFITFRQLHGHLLVPVKFVVPYFDTNWPKATWGIPLGNCVYRIRHRNDFLRDGAAYSRRDQLDNLGFIWNVQELRFQTFYKALQCYADHGEGKTATNTNNLHRNIPLRVPSTFVVPHNSSAWPTELWGYPLGAKCTAVRQKQLYLKGHPHRQILLEKLGFQWRNGSGNASLGWLKLVHAAAIYSKLHHRELDVPYNFKVPAPPTDNKDPQLRVDSCTAVDEGNVWPWPEYLWGLPLGQRLKDVRLKGAYLKGKNGVKRRQQLDALGFQWNPKRGRPSKKKKAVAS